MDHGLIVDTLESSLEWQESNSESLTGANRSWDGDNNTAQMIDKSSPAQEGVAARSVVLLGDWYLPSIDELSLLWQNCFHTNKALSEEGHTLLHSDDIYLRPIAFQLRLIMR